MSVGHNTLAGDQLKSIIERLERIDEEKKEVADQAKDVLAQAKAYGFDTKAIKSILKLRKKPADQRDEEASMLDLYMHAIGMAPHAPLFESIQITRPDEILGEALTDAMLSSLPKGAKLTVTIKGKSTTVQRAADGTVTKLEDA